MVAAAVGAGVQSNGDQDVGSKLGYNRFKEKEERGGSVGMERSVEVEGEGARSTSVDDTAVLTRGVPRRRGRRVIRW